MGRSLLNVEGQIAIEYISIIFHLSLSTHIRHICAMLSLRHVGHGTSDNWPKPRVDQFTTEPRRCAAVWPAWTRCLQKQQRRRQRRRRRGRRAGCLARDLTGQAVTSLFHAITLVSLKVSRYHMCIVSPTCSLVLAKLVRPFFNLLIFVLAIEGFYMLELFF